jgi:hypothetical protein
MRTSRFVLAWSVVFALGTGARGTITESQVLLLINGDSETSAYIAKMYREYYPGIADSQIVKLRGLPDCGSAAATAADEIITREQYENLIAAPIRDHLLQTGLVDSIQCIITTAGIPYRIEDTDPAYADVVKVAGSNANLVASHYGQIDAASVESELSLLWLSDPALAEWPAGPGLSPRNRVVNPYHGYESPVSDWYPDRDILTRRQSFRWTVPMLAGGAKMEGLFDPNGLSALDRLLCPADMYLVVRLDGPRNRGQTPIFAVREMLERATRVSRPEHVRFCGYSPTQSVIVFDHAPAAPGGNLVNNLILNFPPTWDFGGGPQELQTIWWQDFPTPPTSDVNNGGDDYTRGFEVVTGETATFGQITGVQTAWGLGAKVYFDGTSTKMRQYQVLPDESLFALATFGKNSDDGRNRDYIRTGGPGGGPLFRMVPGAVFASAESFNAVTMFLDYNTYQGKIADFLLVGGTGAIGHAFEPMSDALVDAEFFFSNMIRDDDGDGVSDLTFAEAAFTALPYLSWSEVVVGDPLMRLHVGPGAKVYVDEAGEAFEVGDYDGDGLVGPEDGVWILASWGSQFGDDRYDDKADFDRSGTIDFNDFSTVIGLYGTDYDALSEAAGNWNHPAGEHGNGQPGQVLPGGEETNGDSACN